MSKQLTAEQIVKLSKRLSGVPRVAQFDIPGEPQGATLAHALSDLEESFSGALELVPKLLDTSLDSDAIHDVLLEIGEELRHILYHVHDTRFFQYLLDEPPPNEH